MIVTITVKIFHPLIGSLLPCFCKKIASHADVLRGSSRVPVSVVLQYVLGFTCPNESMLIGLFRQTQFADERKWLFVSADVSGAGTRDEPLRTSAWEASKKTNQRQFSMVCIL